MGKNMLCCVILHLFHDVFASVLDVDSLDSMIHTLSVQVIDGQIVCLHHPIHYLLDAARVTICQGRCIFVNRPSRRNFSHMNFCLIPFVLLYLQFQTIENKQKTKGMFVPSCLRKKGLP